MENSIDWRMFLHGHLFKYSCIYKWSIVALPLAPSPSYLFLASLCYIFTAIILQGIYKHISQLFIICSSIKCNWNLHPGKSPQKMNIAYTWCRNAAINHAVKHATPASPPPHPRPSESSVAIIPLWFPRSIVFFSTNESICMHCQPLRQFANWPRQSRHCWVLPTRQHAPANVRPCAPAPLFPPPPSCHALHAAASQFFQWAVKVLFGT